MKRVVLLAVLLLASLHVRAHAQDANGAPTQMAQSLRDGHIEVVDMEHPQTGVRWGRATAIVDVTPDQAWRVITDYAHYAEFLPHFRASRVLSRRGNQALIYLEATALRDTITLWSQMRMREMPAQGATQVIEANMTEGNVERMAARWEVTPIDDGTHCIVTFQFIIEPDLPFPSSVVTNENRKSARKTIEALRRRVSDVASNVGPA